MTASRLEVAATRSEQASVTTLGEFGFAGLPSTTVELRAVLDLLLAHLDTVADAEPAHAWTYRLVDAHGGVHTERAISEAAARHPELHDTLVTLVHASGAGARGQRPWADAETPTGAAAITAVAVADAARVDDYLRYLRGCDLTHEVHQADELDALVGAHGWSTTTIALAAARIAGCTGQSGDEQFRDWLDDTELASYLATPDGHAAFLAALRAELAAGPTPGTAPGTRACSNLLGSLPEPAFEERFAYLLDDLAEVLTETERAELAAYVRAQRG